jgi:hypothetical protein
MPGKRPHLKQKVKAMLNRQTALELIGAGLPVSEASRQLGITVQSVRRLLRQSLASESLFPNNLTADKISQLRQLESEKLQMAWRRVAEAFTAADPKNGIVIARLAEASAKLSERQAKMWGLEAPTRIVEESLRLQVTKSEQKITISWDQNQLAAPADPVPGLFIGGRTPAVALDNGSGSLNGHVMTADGGTNPVPDDSREVVV